MGREDDEIPNKGLKQNIPGVEIKKPSADVTVADSVSCAAMCGAASGGPASCLLAPRRCDGSVMWRRAIAIDSTFITLWL